VGSGFGRREPGATDWWVGTRRDAPANPVQPHPRHDQRFGSLRCERSVADDFGACRLGTVLLPHCRGFSPGAPRWPGRDRLWRNSDCPGCCLPATGPRELGAPHNCGHSRLHRSWYLAPLCRTPPTKRTPALARSIGRSHRRPAFPGSVVCGRGTWGSARTCRTSCRKCPSALATSRRGDHSKVFDLFEPNPLGGWSFISGGHLMGILPMNGTGQVSVRCRRGSKPPGFDPLRIHVSRDRLRSCTRVLRITFPTRQAIRESGPQIARLEPPSTSIAARSVIDDEVPKSG
jgi:hypothetical protein